MHKLHLHFSIGFYARTMLAALLLLSPINAKAGYQEGLKMVAVSNWSMAMDEFLPMANSGHAPSQFSIGLIYQLGRGVPRDPEKASAKNHRGVAKKLKDLGG